MRDEGHDWVRLDLYEQDGSSLGVRVPRQVLPPYALVLLAAGLRKT